MPVRNAEFFFDIASGCSWMAATQVEALARRMFDAPAPFVDGELHRGIDPLDVVEEALRKPAR